MAAFFRKALIFEMEGGDAGALESARRGLRIERVAIAGVGVGNDRDIHDIHHRRQPVDDGVHGDQAEIGNAGRARDRAAAGIDRGKAGKRYEPRRKPVIGARRHGDVAGGEQASQFCRSAHGCSPLRLLSAP